MNQNLYRNEALDVIARNIISKCDPSLLHTPAPIPIEAIIEQVYKLDLDFQYIRKNGRILGETVFEDCMVPIYERRNGEGYKLVPFKSGTIIIDMSLHNRRSDGRYHYTCAHELSHWVIDKDYFTQLGEMAAKTKTTVRSSESDKAVERQADRLACRILMPKGTVKSAFYNNVRQGNVVDYLAKFFRVSNEAMKYRLEELGLLP